MPTPTITEEHIYEFFRLNGEGMTQPAAAASMGLRAESIRKAALRLGIEWQDSPYLKNSDILKIVRDRYDEIAKSDKSQSYWAKEIGTTQAYLSMVFEKLGLTKARNKERQGHYNYDKVAIARKVIGYIAENGGHVVNALKQLDIRTSQPQHIREFARAVGFDLSHYLYAWRTFGNWITIPGPVTHLKPAQNVMVPAVCTCCGNIKPLNLTNAKAGRTNSCAACVKGQGRKFRVMNAETGEIYRSIMAFVNANGLTGRYQTARVKLLADGKFIHKDVEFTLLRD